MITSLAYPLPSYVEIGSYRFELDLAFDHVLKWMDLLKEVQDDASITMEDYLSLSLELLLKEPGKAVRLPAEAQYDLLKKIQEEHLTAPPRPSFGRSEAPSMDFAYDSAEIYSSFVQAYQIDLYAEQGRLQWAQFIALLGGLPANTKLREIIAIRTREIPEPTQHNHSERQQLLELKAYYALPVKGQHNYKQGLEQVWSLLASMAQPMA